MLSGSLKLLKALEEDFKAIKVSEVGKIVGED